MDNLQEVTSIGYVSERKKTGKSETRISRVVIWMNMLKWAQHVKNFVSSGSVHQEVFTMEEILNNQNYRMTPSPDSRQPLYRSALCSDGEHMNQTAISPPGSSLHAILQARILEWVAIPFLQGIFLTQTLNPDLLHCRQFLYCLSNQGNPIGSLYELCMPQ